MRSVVMVAMPHKPIPAVCSQCGKPVTNAVTGCRMPNVVCKECYGPDYYNRIGRSWESVACGRCDNIRDADNDPERMEITGGT